MLRRKPLFLLAFFLLCSCGSHHGTNPSTILADADRFAMLYNWPKAAPLYAQAQELFQKSGDRKNVLSARLGYIWATADQGVNANLTAEVDRDLSTPLIQGDSRLTLRALVARAALDREQNEASGRATWQKIQSLARNLNDKRWQERAEAELGEITYMDGDVESAVRMFKDAVLSQLLHRDLGAAIFYISMVGNGLVETGEPQRGFEYCERAERMTNINNDAGFPFLAYQGQARALIALHRGSEAQSVLNKALAQARAQTNRSAETQLLIVAGDGAFTRDPNKAIEYLRAANDLAAANGFRHAFAWSGLELAKAYRAAGDLKSAEAFASQALGAMGDTGDKYHLPEHLALLADLEARTGRTDQAARLYERATDVIDALLVDAPSPEIESSLIATQSEVYLGHFRLAVAEHRNTATAFGIIEEARGRSLADALRSPPVADPPPDATTVKARQDIGRIQLALLHETEPNKRRQLLDGLFEAEQVATPTNEPDGALRSLATHPRPVQLTDLKSVLQPTEMILEYVLEEPRSYCLRITRNRATVVPLPADRSKIVRAIDNYLAEIRAGRAATASGRVLYSLLLQPVIANHNEPDIVVVPDGRLNLLPFDALTNGTGRLVLESHVVSYVPSGTVLYLLRTAPQTATPTRRFLGIGGTGTSPQPGRMLRTTTALNDPFQEDPIQLGSATKTHDEIVDADRALGGHGTLLLGKDATEGAFKSQPLGDFQIIHVATHGIANQQFPDRAALVFAADSQPTDDGLLQVPEIMHLDLHAELVVLSGCDTAAGDLEGEEGTANLARAFLVAGSRSVVASLWATSDIYAQNLMQHVYGHIAQGQGPAPALRYAKLDLIQEFGEQTVPLLWAEFVLIGDPAQPFSSPTQYPDCCATSGTSSRAPKVPDP
ncbi:MAG TPA: CHAT domain-containing tetratricopeptide repeat protein [Candidatus Eisenbacteria bacterium]|nr:CHAT domain-containing tetratricopeptide repeat protein [Candidatus Eisenbacteria bacterium]